MRPDWFIHENVVDYPGEMLREDAKKNGYNVMWAHFRPEIFGRPMARQDSMEMQHATARLRQVCLNLCLVRVGRERVYMIFFKAAKLEWRGPSLSGLLASCGDPKTPLRVKATDFFFMTATDVVACLPPPVKTGAPWDQLKYTKLQLRLPTMD